MCACFVCFPTCNKFTLLLRSCFLHDVVSVVSECLSFFWGDTNILFWPFKDVNYCTLLSRTRNLGVIVKLRSSLPDLSQSERGYKYLWRRSKTADKPSSQLLDLPTVVSLAMHRRGPFINWLYWIAGYCGYLSMRWSFTSLHCEQCGNLANATCTVVVVMTALIIVMSLPFHDKTWTWLSMPSETNH